MRPRIVTVFGSSRPKPPSREYQDAFELGRGIATAGWTLCNGGYGGTMEAAAKGAIDAGGHTIGVTCSVLGGRGGANQYIRQEIPTFYLLTRLDTLVRLGNAYVVLPGGTGTLLELALVWELLNKRLLRRSAPIIVLGEHWQTVVDTVVRTQPEALPLQVAKNVAVALDMLTTHLSVALDG